MDCEPLYRVIANCEDEFCVWPVDRPIPAAWRALPIMGVRQECLTYIRLVDGAASGMVRRVTERGTRLP